MKMGLVEPVCCDGIAKGVTVGEDEFQNLLGILDFPMESLEGDDELSGDWDASKSQSLGPIPSEALMGLPPVPTGNLGDAFSNGPLKLNAHKGGGSLKPKELPNNAKQSSSAHFGHDNVLSDAQESGIFQTQSPVSVLESGGSCSGGKSLPIKPHITIPVRTRSKRARASVFNPWFLMTPISSSTSAFKKTSSYMKSKDKEKLSEALLSSNTVLEMTHDSSKQGKEELFYALDVAENDETSFQRSVPTKKCTHCQVTKTPQWREGPMGPKTLCNACGVRYRSGRLYPEYRPLASPSFVPTLHSNSHRKVVEMRKKAIMQEPGIIHETSISQATEIIPELHLNLHRKVLGMRNKAVMLDNDFVYDASLSPPPPDFVPKRRKVVGMRKQAFMQENDILHSAAVSPAPELVPNLDSNSPRKFMGMRKKAIMQETDIIHDAPMSPAPEFVPMSSYLFDFIY